jgi:hypothetical protein
MGHMGSTRADRAARRAGGAAQGAVVLASVPLILAHVAISLLVLSPRQGDTVAPDADAVILAQRTLGGVDHTDFTVRLDGEWVDGPNGPIGIRVGDSVTVSLPRMEPGPHRLEIDYRPDLDEPIRTATVDFEVAGAGTSRRSGLPASSPARLLVLGAAMALLAGGGLLLRRRARSSRFGSRAGS